MKAQECKELRKIDGRIVKEKLRRKFELNEIEGQIFYFYFDFNLCGIVEKFNFFEVSKLGDIDEILSTECIFADVSPFLSYFESSLNFIRDWNVNFDFNSNWEKEWMMKNIKSIYFVNTKDRTDCHRFFSIFFLKVSNGSHFWRERDIFFHQILTLKWK
jgi:hypothetical protein